MVANINLLGLPDYTGQSGQTGSKYAIAIDAAAQVFAQIARNFAPHASEAGSPSAPDMTVTLDPGRVWNPIARTYTTVASQTTGTITAPAGNPRRDIVYIDRLTGVFGVTAGSEAASPADPQIPVGKIPVARINLTVGMTVIDDMDIDDLRTFAMLGVPFGSGDELARIAPGSSSPDEAVRGTLDEFPVWQKVAGIWRCVQLRHMGFETLQRLDTGSPSEALDEANDLIPVWNRSQRELMMMAAGEVGGGTDITLGTEKSASGSSVDFTGIPAGTKRVTITWEDVSTNGTTDDFLVQIGDSGGLETSSYVSTSLFLATGPSIGAVSSTAGFVVNANLSTDVWSGQVILVLSDNTNNTWIESHMLKATSASGAVGAGSKSLSAALDRVRITFSGGTDSFDAGSFNVLYE